MHAPQKSRRASSFAGGLAIAIGLAALHAGCSSDPPNPAAAFCGSASDAVKKCADASGGCGEAFVTDCAKIAAALNPTTLEAATSCLSAATCEGAPLAKCLPEAAKAAKPTDAQKVLAKSYCNTCTLGGGVEACEETFYGKDGAPSALGLLLLPFGDGVVRDVDKTCASTPGCGATFPACAGGVLTKALVASVPADTAECTLGALAGRDEGGGGGGGDGGTDAGKPPACDTSNCPGCCDATGACVPGDAQAACGHAGKTCSACDAATACTDGVCIATACKATCLGCCGADGCAEGKSVSACGSSGATCQVCGTGRACNGGCKVDPDSLWDVFAVKGEVAAKNASGGAWDPFNGDPDPAIEITVQNKSGKSGNINGTFTPTWNQTVIADAKAFEIIGLFNLKAIDDDPVGDDIMGTCTVKLDDTYFDQAVHVIECPKLADSTPFKFYFKLVKKP
jgi:C2 domain